MNRTLSKVLWIVAGALLIIAGIICLCNPGTALVSMCLFMGILMLFSGIVDIVIFAKGNQQIAGAGWFLADGILSFILGLMLLFNQTFALVTLPFIFGMWLLFSGINSFANSFELKRLGIRGWGWFTALGVILIVIGFFSFFDPVADLFALSVLVGILLIAQGFSIIVRACFSHRLWL